MPEAKLYALSPLDGFTQTYDNTRVWESDTLVAMAIAMPSHDAGDLDKRLQSLCKLSYPEAGVCLRSAENDNKLGASLALLGLQKSQCLLVVDKHKPSINETLENIRSALNDTAYLTDQSDSLAVLNIQGALAIPALERMCMLDLSLFDENKVARTLMEHLSVIIEKPGPEHFRLYAPRSSAQSFLHIVTTALSSVMFEPAHQAAQQVTSSDLKN